MADSGNPFTSPEAIASIASGGAGILQSILQNKASGNLNAQNLAAQRQNLLAQLMAGLGNDQSNDMFNRQQAYTNTFNMNPVGQAQHIFHAGALGDLAARGATHVGPGGVSNPFQVSAQTQGYVGPQALAENAARFYGAAGALNPAATAPDLASLGFGQAGADRQGGMQQEISNAGTNLANLNQQRRGDLISLLQQNQQPQQQQQQHGGGFWGFLKKVLPIAANFIPIPGVGPIVSGAIHAGIGIGSQFLPGGGGGGGMQPNGQPPIAMSGVDYFNRPRQ